MENDKEHRAGRLLTVAQVAEELAISPRQVRSLMRSGAIPFVDLGPRTRRVERSALDAWIESRRAGT